MADFDSPWKEALDLYFQAFLAFFFPAIHNDIDWSRGFESLDKELQQIAPRAGRGRRYVDKLVKVWRKNGHEVWVLIHVEVQTRPERGFARRMYVYNYRIADRYERPVVSLAVLADDNPKWRPSSYRDELWGWSLRMAFPEVKLLDYADREAELEADTNPFARVVLVHLKAQQTRKDPEGRRAWKFRLVRGLYERGFKAEDVRQLFRLIDWLMELPPPLEQAFRRELDEYQEERQMPYVTSFTRLAMLEMIERLLRARFGAEGAKLMGDINALYSDADKLMDISDAIGLATNLDDVRQAVAQATAPPKKPSRSKRK
jgi:hypothetical protein